jgi:poly(A) polymerase
MWFIGLEFAKTENLNVNLTYDIQSFTETVQNHALNINMLKEGMKLEARHVKRKQLYQYLSPSLLKRERKSSVSAKSQANGTENKKRYSDQGNSDSENPNKKIRLSEELHTTVSDSI